MTILDPRHPLRSLRAAAGIGGVPLTGAALARARGMAQSSAQQSEAAGDQIAVATLRGYVEALGGTLEIRVTLPGSTGEKSTGVAK